MIQEIESRLENHLNAPMHISGGKVPIAHCLFARRAQQSALPTIKI